MGWFSDFISNPIGTVVQTVSNPVESVVNLSHAVTAPIADPFDRGDVTAGDVAIAAAIATGGAGLAGYGPLAGAFGGELAAGAVLDASASSALIPLEAVSIGSSAVATVEAGTAAASGGILGGLFDGLSWPSWLTPGVAQTAAQVGLNLTAPRPQQRPIVYSGGYPVTRPGTYPNAMGYPSMAQDYSLDTMYAPAPRQASYYPQNYATPQAQAQSISPGLMLIAAAAVGFLAIKKA